MENSLCRGLARSVRAEPHPIFSVPGVKLPDGFLLLCVEIQLLDRYLRIDSSVRNAGKRSGERLTKTGFLKSMSRKSTSFVLATVLVLATGLVCCAEEGRTSHGWLTI